MYSKKNLIIPNGYLRSLNETDVTDQYIEGLNDQEVNKYLEIRHTRQTIDTVKKFVNINASSKDAILFGIFEGSSEKLIGTIRLHSISQRKKNAHIGICIFDKLSWGLGFGRNAVKVVTRWSFHHLKLNKINAGIYIENFSSKKIFLNSGYKLEGIIFENLGNKKKVAVQIYSIDLNSLDNLVSN